MLQSTAVPIPIEDIDTDQIIPARFLKATSREGFGENLFRDWRYSKGDVPNPDFILNNPTYQGQILVAGKISGADPAANTQPGPFTMPVLKWWYLPSLPTSSKGMRSITAFCPLPLARHFWMECSSPLNKIQTPLSPFH